MSLTVELTTKEQLFAKITKYKAQNLLLLRKPLSKEKKEQIKEIKRTINTINTPEDYNNLLVLLEQINLETRAKSKIKDKNKRSSIKIEDLIKDLKEITYKELAEVRQMSSAQNTSQDSLLLQLMTGYIDPKDKKDDANYSTKNYQTIASSIYSRIPPWDVKKEIKDENDRVIGFEDESKNFFTQLNNAYGRIQTPEDKAVFLHNTKILLSNLITANTSPKYLDATNSGIQTFYAHVRTADNNPEYDFESVRADLMGQISSIKNVNKKVDTEQDTPIQAGRKSFPETFSSETNKQAAKEIAQDLKEVQLRLLRQLDLSDMHSQKWTKDKKKHELSYANITKIFNDFSNMVINDIVSAKTEEEQQRIYSLYLDVATEAVKLNDFQTAVAIKAGLKSVPVGRLKHLIASKKNKNNLNQLIELYSTDGNSKKLRAANNEARESDGTFVPFLGTFNTDLTFIDDGNPDKVRDKDNGVKFLQEGVVIGFIADAKLKALQSERKPYIFDICTRISRPSELSDKEQYNKSMIFCPRNPVNLSEIKSLSDLASCFKENSIHTMLSVTLEKDGKEYTDTKAFQHVVNTILPLYMKPKLSDKLDGSSANTILNSIEQWAINHDQTSPELTEQIQLARKAILPTKDDTKQLDQLQAYQDRLVQTYINADVDKRRATREDVNEFKNGANSYITGEIDKILIALNSIDGVDKLYKNYQDLNSVASEEPMPTDIHVSLTTLLELDALATQTSEQKSSTIDHVKDIATNIHKDITDDNGVFVDYNKKLLANIAKDIDKLPDIYKTLLIHSSQNPENSEDNDAKLKNILDTLNILMKDPILKEQASTANKTIDNLLKLDKCQAEKFENLSPENQIKSARDIVQLLNDDDLMVKQWAEELSKNPDIEQQIEEAKNADSSLVESLQSAIISKIISHVDKLSTKDKNYNIEEAESKIKTACQDSLDKLDAMKEGPFEEVRTVASIARENIENQYKSYIAQVEKHNLGEDTATKVQVSKPKGQKRQSKNAAKEAEIAHLSDAEREICQKFDLSSKDIGILKIYGMDSLSKIEEWQQTFESVESQKHFGLAFSHIGERITPNYPSSEETAARMALAVLIAVDLNEKNISKLDFETIESECIEKLIQNNAAYSESRKEALYLVQKIDNIESYQGSFSAVMFKLSGKSEIFSKKKIKEIKEKFRTKDKQEAFNPNSAIEDHVHDFFAGMAPIQSEIKTSQIMLTQCNACLTEYQGNAFDNDGRLTSEFIAYIKSDKDIPASYTDTNSYDSMLFRHMMSHLQAQDNTIKQEIDSQNDVDEMEVLFSVVAHPEPKAVLEAETPADELIAQKESLNTIIQNLEKSIPKNPKDPEAIFLKSLIQHMKIAQTLTDSKKINVQFVTSQAYKTCVNQDIPILLAAQLDTKHTKQLNDLKHPAIFDPRKLATDLPNISNTERALIMSVLSDKEKSLFNKFVELSKQEAEKNTLQTQQESEQIITIEPDIVQQDEQVAFTAIEDERQNQQPAVSENKKASVRAVQELVQKLIHDTNNVTRDELNTLNNNLSENELVILEKHLEYVTKKNPQVHFAEGTDGVPKAKVKKEHIIKETEIPILNIDAIKQTPEMTTIYLSMPATERYYPTAVDKELYVRNMMEGTLRLNKDQKSTIDSRSINYFTDAEDVEIYAEMRVEETKNKSGKNQIKPNDVIIVELQVPKAVLLDDNIINVDVSAQIAKYPELFKIQSIQTYEQKLAENQTIELETENAPLPEVWSPTISIDDETKAYNSAILSNLNNEIDRVQSTGGDNKTQLNALYSLRSICETRSNFGTIDFESIVEAVKISMLPEQCRQFDMILDTYKIPELFESEKQVTVQQPTDGELQEDSVDTDIEVIIKPDTEDESDQAKLLKLQELAFQFASNPKKDISKSELEFLSENLTALEKKSSQWAKLLEAKFTPVAKPQVKSSTIIEEQQTSPADPVGKKRRASTFLNQSLQAAKKPKIDHEAPKQATQTAKQPPVSNQQVMQQLKQAQKTGTGTADNLSIQAITDAAIAQKRADGANSKIVDIKTFPNDEDKKQGVMVSFKTDKPGTVVKTYAEDMGNDKVQFSIQKNASEEHKNTGIQEMCRLAVAAADKNTIFNVPASNKNPERQKFIEQCFKDAILDATTQNKFPDGVPTINLSTSPPPPAPRKGPGTRGGAASAA